MPKNRLLREINEQVGGTTVVVTGAVSAASAGGANDHGNLAGLSDDDHPQYLNTTRHAAIDAADHGSGTATDGYVLTADGAGGAAWEAGGGTPDAGDVTYTPTTAADWDSDTDPGDVDDALDQLAERVDDLEGAGYLTSVDAAAVTYTPTTAADWDGSADPGDVDGALDQLAERVKDIEDAGGGGSPDASAVTYTPTTATDWDSDSDPGNVDDALDQLAERVDDLEGAGGGGDVATDAIWDAAGDLVQGTGANTAARLAVGTANQLLRVNSGATAAEWASVGRVLISEQTSDGSSGTVTFNSIAGSYKTLYLEYVARSQRAAANDSGLKCYLNNDSTDGNYRRAFIAHYGTTVASQVANDARIGFLTAASAPANSPGSGYIRIIEYAGSTFNKLMIGRYSYRYSAGSSNELVHGVADVEWESNAAVTRIDVIDENANFVSGSVFRLYGEY